jgi:hypothetical protein
MDRCHREQQARVIPRNSARPRLRDHKRQCVHAPVTDEAANALKISQYEVKVL